MLKILFVSRENLLVYKKIKKKSLKTVRSKKYILYKMGVYALQFLLAAILDSNWWILKFFETWFRR